MPDCLRAEGIHIRQSPHARVTTITCTSKVLCVHNVLVLANSHVYTEEMHKSEMYMYPHNNIPNNVAKYLYKVCSLYNTLNCILLYST